MLGRIILGIFTLLVVGFLIYAETYQGKIPAKTSNIYNFVTASFFCFTGLACLTVLIFLIKTIREAFTNELNQEMKQLIISEMTFVLTFLVRVVLIICVFKNQWIDFSRDYPKNMLN